jgi:hypothetical protein
LADWEQEYGDPTEADFHSQVSQWLPGKLGHANQIGVEDNQWLLGPHHPQTTGGEPFDLRTFDPGSLTGRVLMPHTGFRENPRWSSFDFQHFASPEQLGDFLHVPHDVARSGLKLEEQYPELRSSPHFLRTLNPAEMAYLGLHPGQEVTPDPYPITENTDPGLWPSLEKVLRDRHRRGLRFEVEEHPTEYGTAEDEAAFRGAIDHDPLDITNHRVFSDFLRDQGRDQDADYRQAVADSLIRRLSQKWAPPMTDRFGYLHQMFGPEDDYTHAVKVRQPGAESIDVGVMQPARGEGWTEYPYTPEMPLGHRLPGQDDWAWDVNEIHHGLRPLDEFAGHGIVGDLPWTPEWREDRRQGFQPGVPAGSFFHPHVLRPAERIFAGIDDIQDQYNTQRYWHLLEEIMRDRFDRGQRLEDDQTPVNYGTQDELLRAVHQNPLEIGAHGALADWHRDQGDDREADFRQAVADSLTRRLSTKWKPPVVAGVGHQRMASPAAQGPGYIPIESHWNLNSRGQPVVSRDVPTYSTPEGNFPEGSWFWGFHDVEGYNDRPSDDLSAWLGLGPDESPADFEYIPWYLGRRYPEHQHQSGWAAHDPGHPMLLRPWERAFAGIDDISNIDPALWPQLEALMRRQHGRGLRLSRDGR